MDIKSRISLVGVIVLAVVSSSCVSTGALYKGLVAKKANLDYIHDTDLNYDSNMYQVHIARPVITDAKFTMPGRVTKLKVSVIPAILYNSWKTQYEYRVGSAAATEDITAFIQKAFTEESNRSGTFAADTITSADGLTLQVEIDSIGAQGPYYSQGHFLFLLFVYSWSTSETTGEGTAYSRFHYTLRQGSKILVDDYVSNQEKTQPLRQTHTSPKTLRVFYNANLVEALSFTFKANIEAIVKNIDFVLDPTQIQPGKIGTP